MFQKLAAYLVKSRLFSMLIKTEDAFVKQQAEAVRERLLQEQFEINFDFFEADYPKMRAAHERERLEGESRKLKKARDQNRKHSLQAAKEKQKRRVAFRKTTRLIS